MASTPQLTLAISLPDDETFDSFYGVNNQVCTARIKAFLTNDSAIDNSPCFYLYGNHGVGKSHLLHASCAYAETLNISNFCMSFSQLKELSVEVLDGLEQFQLVCLDGIELIAGDETWQQAVFDLYNRITEQGNKIIIAGDNSVSELNITLPDLVSRLSWGQTEQVKALADDDKIIALQGHAKQRGMEIPSDVAKYLINHHTRDMKSLIASLNQLDKASIREQRKITIPFIKEVLFSD